MAHRFDLEIFRIYEKTLDKIKYVLYLESLGVIEDEKVISDLKRIMTEYDNRAEILINQTIEEIEREESKKNGKEI